MDDQMRMQAVVVDGFTGPLKKLNESLRATGSVKTGAVMRKDWEGVRKEITGVTRELNTAFSPVLRGVGITSLGIGAAITGMIVGLKNTAQSGRSLKFLSDQLGTSVNKLRELEALGEHFDIPVGQTESALKGLATTMNELERNWGSAYNTLRNRNLGWMAEDLKKAFEHGGVGEAFDKVIEDLKKIPNLAYRREIAQMLLGSDQWSVVATEQSNRLREKIKREIGVVSPEQLAAEQRLTDSLKETNRQIGELWTHSAPLIEFFNHGLEGLNELLGKFRKYGWSEFTGSDPEDRRRKLALNLSAKEYKLKGVDSDISAFTKRGDKPAVDDLQSERRQLVDEIAKLRKELEDINKDQLLHKQSFIGGGAGMPAIISAMYSGGGGVGAGLGGFGIHPHVSTGGAKGGGIAVPDDAGAGLNSSAYLAARRAGMKAEIARDPRLRNELAGMMMLEGSPVQTMESLANRAEMMNKWRGSRGMKPMSLHEMLHSGFYGPINRGQLPGAIARLQHNPALMKRMGAAIDAVMGGSNTVKGYTDQGMPSDPNGAWGMRHGHMMKGGNLFTDWGGGPGHDYARRFREQQQDAVRDGGPATAGIPVPRTDPRKGAQTMEGHATLHVQLDGLPSSAKTHFAYGGMFREVRLTRTNRQAALADDYVS
jgi:hypothetical protein